MSDALEQWVIYEHPKTWPNGYAVRRRFVGVDGVAVPDPVVEWCDTLDLARRQVPEGLRRIQPASGEDPEICEVWI